MRNLFATITKVDVSQGLVYGRLTEEIADKVDETLDYAGSKPLFEAWSNEAAKATGGKSLGNVREMHQLRAVGKLTGIDFLDDDRAVDICAKVADQDVLDKCEDGIYTGFSVGGKLVKRWKDGDVTKIIINPSECSIVDNPCVPTAHFTCIKAAGASEEKAFKLWAPANSAVAAKATDIAKAEGEGILWTDRIEEARAALIKAHADEAIGTSEDPAGETDPPAPAEPAPTIKAAAHEALADAIKAAHPDIAPDDLEVALIELEGEDPGEAGKAMRETAIKAWAPWDLIAKADAKEGDKPDGNYGDVEYADPGYQKDKKPRYPVDTEKHIRAAWSYINKEKNQEPYSADEVSKIKAKIVSAWKDKIDKEGPPAAKDDKAAESDLPEWTQVWRTRDGSTFPKKAEAITHAGALRASSSPLALVLKADPVAAAEMVPVPKVPALGRAVKAYKAVREAFADNVVFKGLYAVSSLARMIEELGWLVMGCGYETQAEGDDSKVPADLAASLKSLCECLCSMCLEETSELIEALAGQGIAVEVMDVDDDAIVIELADGAQVIKAASDIYKAGSRNSQADQERLQAAHDAVAACGADCDPDNLPDVEDKATGSDSFKALQAENEARKVTEKAAGDEMTSLKAMVVELTGKVTALEAQPGPSAPGLFIIGKGEVPGGEAINYLSKLTPDQLADLAIKAAQRNPQLIAPGLNPQR